jgi:hypothetical protein
VRRTKRRLPNTRCVRRNSESEEGRDLRTKASTKRGLTSQRILVAALVGMIAAFCGEKSHTPNGLRIAMRGVDLTLTATMPVTIKRAVLNARTGDGRCDSDAPPIKTDDGSMEVHKVPVSLHAGDHISIRWNPECGAVYKAEITTDENDYKLNFVP